MRRGHVNPERSAVTAARRRALAFLALVVVSHCLAGCAALTNPVAHGVPVRDVPPELLAPSQEGKQLTPLNLFRQPPPGVYQLAPGDILGVWVDGVPPLSQPNQVPPVHFPQRASLPAPERNDLAPSLGIPIPVREDGTISLPLVGPLRVQGMSLAQAEDAVRQAYTGKGILQAGQERVLVTLMRPRLTRVLVFRHDLPAANLNNSFNVTTVGSFNGDTELVGSTISGAGYAVDLPAYENDLLTALAFSGGFPGSSAADYVVIYRHYFGGAGPGVPGPPIYLPLRTRPGEQLCFRLEDILLQNGDAVFVEARKVCTFFTGGLLPPGEHVLPRDYDLDVVEAVMRVKGPLVNGAFGGSNLNGFIIAPGIGGPNPRLLTVIRRTPNGGQIPIRVDLNRALVDPWERIRVQPGDVLILQETPLQALARYFSEKFDFSLVSQVIRTNRTTGTITLTTP